MKMNLYSSVTGPNLSREKFINSLITDFAKEYDFDPSSPPRDINSVYFWITGPEGTRAIATWLSEIGWKVKYWELGPLPNGKLLAYGFDFDNACPHFIAAKLKYHESQF